MFKVTIIKLKDIIKIGIILILIYVFSNFILKHFRKNNLLNTSYHFDSIIFVKAGIERQSNIIKEFSKDNNTKINQKKEKLEKNDELFDIKTILNIGSNLFLLKNSENNDGQDDIKAVEGDKENRSRCHQNRG